MGIRKDMIYFRERGREYIDVWYYEVFVLSRDGMMIGFWFIFVVFLYDVYVF